MVFWAFLTAVAIFNKIFWTPKLGPKITFHPNLSQKHFLGYSPYVQLLPFTLTSI